MAAVIAPPAAAGAPTGVTISGTVPANNLAITLLANDPFVVSHPSLPFILSAVIPGGGPQTAPLAMGLAIRTWTGRLTLNNPATVDHASTPSAFTVAFTSWPRAYAKNTEKDTEKDTEEDTEKVQHPRRKEAWGARTNYSP